MRERFTAILTAALLVCLAIFGSVIASAATLEAEITQPEGCVGEGICDPVTEFRIYEVTGELVGVAATQGISTFDLDYELVNGEEYCFNFTAFNDVESAVAQSCAVAEFGAPTSPAIIRLEFK